MQDYRLYLWLWICVLTNGQVWTTRHFCLWTQTLNIDLAEKILEIEMSASELHFFLLLHECQCSMQWNWKRLTLAWYDLVLQVNWDAFQIPSGDWWPSCGDPSLWPPQGQKNLRSSYNSMALTGHALLTRNPAHNQLQAHNKRDIHGVVRTACANCTECPQVDFGGGCEDVL